MTTASKAPATRVYKVVSADKSMRLIRASHPTTALRHVADDQFTVSVADSVDFELAIKAGIQVEHLKGSEQLQLPTDPPVLTDKVTPPATHHVHPTGAAA